MRRFLFSALLGLALYVALFGGRYSVFSLAGTRSSLGDESADLEAARAELDSLRAWVDSLETDIGTLERLARENYRMIRPGEIVYLPTEPVDSTGDGGSF